MAAGHGNAALVADHPTEQFGPVADFQARCAGGGQFRVTGRYGAAHHHQGGLRNAAADGGHRGGVLVSEDAGPPVA